MSILLGHKLLLKFEDWRLHQHFKHVEIVLRNKDVSHLPSIIQKRRKTYLDQLQVYAMSGSFPRNYGHSKYSPCFIDPTGRQCAVAHLVLFSGQSELANNIAAADNYAYVPKMHFSELDDWAVDAGFSKQELALIQPGYYDTFTGTFLWTTVLVSAAAMSVFITNVIQIVRQQRGIIVPAIGLILAFILLLMGIYYLDNLTTVYYLGGHPDISNHERILGDADPLILGILVSFSVALLTGSLAIYRFWNYLRNR